MLSLSFWHIEIANLPKGTFIRTVLDPKTAATMIRAAKDAKLLMGVSREDLVAPYGERERKKHQEMCSVLNEHYDIPITFEDFLCRFEEDDQRGYTVNPIELVEVSGSRKMIVITCHYTLDPGEETGLKFSIAPDSIEFNLFEVAA